MRYTVMASDFRYSIQLKKKNILLMKDYFPSLLFSFYFYQNNLFFKVPLYNYNSII